jgi:hypothetical protein
MYVIQHCFICAPPPDSIVSEDAEIKPMTVATLADALTNRLNLIIKLRYILVEITKFYLLHVYFTYL